MEKKSKKKQGDRADAAGMSDARQVRDPQTMGRGIGSGFAMAVANIMETASEVSGSKNGFLGVEKKQLDPKESLHNSILPKDFDPRKKLME